MKEVTGKLLLSLKNCDTSQILSTYDVAFSHIDRENYRSFIKAGLVRDCKLLNEVIKLHGFPKVEDLSFTKDPESQANIASLSLLVKADSTLNLKSCTLYVMFYPDQFFNDKILRLIIYREYLKEKEPTPIKELIP